MPTPRKVEMLAEIKDRMERASIAISADYRGLSVAQLTDLRRALRPANVEVKVVKNTLAVMAASQAGRPEMSELVQGPTAVAFGFGDPIAPVKALAEHLRARRMQLTILGGWLADRLLGAKRTVMLGALLMSAGHLLMTFDVTFLIALFLLILGSGCLKGNISAQVGTLYPREASSLRDRGFAIFSTGINIGSACGPLMAGGLAAAYGWHAGFALAAALMLLALVIYIAGQRYLPDTRPLRKQRTTGVRLTPAERRRAWALLAVIALTVPAEIAYPMVWSIGMVWVDQQVSLATQWGTIPSIWFGSVDSIGAILSAPLLIALWASQARKGREPGSVTKIAIGTGLIAVAALVIAASNLTAARPGSVFVGWALAGYLLMGLAWMYYWPTTLALISRVAPRAVLSTLMGGAFLSPFIGHTVMGCIGSFYDQMNPAAFWTMDAGIALGGAVLLVMVRGPLARALEAKPGPS